MMCNIEYNLKGTLTVKSKSPDLIVRSMLLFIIVEI